MLIVDEIDRQLDIAIELWWALCKAPQNRFLSSSAHLPGKAKLSLKAKVRRLLPNKANAGSEGFVTSSSVSPRMSWPACWSMMRMSRSAMRSFMGRFLWAHALVATAASLGFDGGISSGRSPLGHDCQGNPPRAWRSL